MKSVEDTRMPHVLVAGQIHDAGVQILRAASGVTSILSNRSLRNRSRHLCQVADAILIRTQPLPRAVIEFCGTSQSRVAARCWL